MEAIVNGTSVDSGGGGGGERERHLGPLYQIVVTVSYVLGVIGNAAALLILCFSGRQQARNRKHTLMLKCLAINDLVALLGMLVLMHYWPRALSNYWKCACRVLLRVFGLGSGCVAIVMAFERWLALTRPFQCKQVSAENMIH